MQKNLVADTLLVSFALENVNRNHDVERQVVVCQPDENRYHQIVIVELFVAVSESMEVLHMDHSVAMLQQEMV